MSQIVRLKFPLNRMKPPVWRRIEVLGDPQHELHAKRMERYGSLAVRAGAEIHKRQTVFPRAS